MKKNLINKIIFTKKNIFIENTLSGMILYLYTYTRIRFPWWFSK